MTKLYVLDFTINTVDSRRNNILNIFVILLRKELKFQFKKNEYDFKLMQYLAA